MGERTWKSVPGGFEPIVTERGAGWAKVETGTINERVRNLTMNRQGQYFSEHMTPPPSGENIRSDSSQDDIYKQQRESVKPF